MKNTIGIVGGIGPYASVHMMHKIFDNTITCKDQDHLSTILISEPSSIEDRSKFLLGKTKNNPGYSIIDVIKRLEKAGANIIGIPCNTAHASKIMDVILNYINHEKGHITLINIIDEVIRYIHQMYPSVKRIGVLPTNGMHYDGEYYNKIMKSGYEPVFLREETQRNLLHETIYDEIYGIKATGGMIPYEIWQSIEGCIEKLINEGAQVVVLACTELPLVIKKKSIKGVPLLDSTDILARALIREADASKLIKL